jgi:tetratricopeptide (TPR) repeat protein
MQEQVGGLDPLEKASELHDLAVSLRAQDQYAAAMAASRQALAVFEREVGPDHPDVANILNTLAGLHQDQGEYGQAEQLLQRSVALLARVPGSLEVVEVLRVQALCGLAGVYRVQGRYGEAEPLFQQALQRAEAALGPDHLEVATCLNNLGVLYKFTGQFAAAGRLYRRALAITQRVLGPPTRMLPPFTTISAG